MLMTVSKMSVASLSQKTVHEFKQAFSLSLAKQQQQKALGYYITIRKYLLNTISYYSTILILGKCDVSLNKL